MKTLAKLSSPLEKINRRSVLGVLGVGVSGVLVACNDDVSPLKLNLKSDMGEINTTGMVMLTATVLAGFADKIEFYETTPSSATDTVIGSQSGSSINAQTQITHGVTFSDQQNGNHTFYSKITSVTSKEAFSNPIVVKVNIASTPAPTLPTIALTSSSAAVTAVGKITLTATVSNGPLTKLEFYEGTTLLGTVNAAPYTFDIAFTNTSATQTHTYTAKGYATAGSADSNAVSVNVNIGNLAPTVSLTSSSSNVTANGSITLTATATPKTGTISSVEFFDGATSLGIVTTSPYNKTIALTAANNGSHNYTAKATDSSGNSATSTPAVAVTVNIPTAVKPPTITLASSSLNVTTAGSVTLTATVTVGTGTITKVEFFEGNTLLATKTAATSTYAPAFTSANNGTHTYTAKVTASDGAIVTSTAVTVTVSITATAGTLIALYTALPAVGSYVNFNHPTSGMKCILYRAPAAQTGGVANAGAYFVAYSRTCTHNGTIIAQNRNPSTTSPHILTCQDHGAQFNLDSNCAALNSPISGKSFGPLPTIVITAGTDGIYI